MPQLKLLFPIRGFQDFCFLALIKLLIKLYNATVDVSSITTNLPVATLSPLPKAPFKGIKSDKNMRIVSNTAMCAIALFSAFIPRPKINRTIPKISGIMDVIEPSTPHENKNAELLHKPSMIRVILFKRFDLYGFIGLIF